MRPAERRQEKKKLASNLFQFGPDLLERCGIMIDLNRRCVQKVPALSGCRSLSVRPQDLIRQVAAFS